MVRKELRRGTDTLDVWIDSGWLQGSAQKQDDLNGPQTSSWDDQHRGWFQSSLWTAMIADGEALTTK